MRLYFTIFLQFNVALALHLFVMFARAMLSASDPRRESLGAVDASEYLILGLLEVFSAVDVV